MKSRNVMVFEEDNLLFSEIKHMLIKMGFCDSHIYKTTGLSVFKSLLKKHKFDLIIIHYSSKDHSAVRNLLQVYHDCHSCSEDCSFVFVSHRLPQVELLEARELKPDHIIEFPFNYNHFEAVVIDGLLKKQLFFLVNEEIDKNNFERIIKICNLLSEKKSTWRQQIYKEIVENLINNRNYNSAIYLLNNIKFNELSEWMLLKLIELYILTGQSEKALEIAHEFEVLGFSSHPLISELTDDNSILNAEIERMITIMEDVVVRYPYIANTHINLAYLYISVSDYDNGIRILNALDTSYVHNTRHLFCIEELKTYLEIKRFLVFPENGRPPNTRCRLQALEEMADELPDCLETTRKMHHLLNSLENHNPILSEKKLLAVWNMTGLNHRKQILTAIAHYCGFTDLAAKWIEANTQFSAVYKTIDDVISAALFNKMQDMIAEKESKLSKAREHKKNGELLASLTILSKEVPSTMIYHINLIEEIVSRHVFGHHDIDAVIQQFCYSIDVIIRRLTRHDSNHPKLEHMQKVKRVVLSKLNSAKQAGQVSRPYSVE